MGVGLFICYFATTVIMVPTRILIPVIVVFSVVGTYAIRTSLFDVKLMFVLSLIGWILRMYGYPAIAVVLGVILGPIVGNELLRTHQMFDGNMLVFFTRPISLFLLFLALLSIVLPILRNRSKPTEGK
jgi:putative tricarboxylic transport membrane protein